MGAGIWAALLTICRRTSGADEPDAKAGKPFTGTSRKGDFQAALDDAIAAALTAARVVDGQAKWTLKEIHGVKGGIAGRNEISVTINAVVP
jgi:hypothetical protein